jgi:drug/metabolite transporter (DMT)-like permease
MDGDMDVRTLKSDALLLMTAAIWGGGFVAQRLGMEHIGPFAFNGIRFALGALSLLPLMVAGRKQGRPFSVSIKTMIIGGSLAGAALFLGATFQQVGLQHTTAGKAGFITGLYLVIVPIMSLVLGQRIDLGTWLGAIIALVGLFLLSVTEELSISPGDLLELIGAFFWAAHLLIIGRFSRRIDPIELSFLQFIACSVFSIIAAAFLESISIAAVMKAGMPILYGGLVSVGVAYTLQVVAQRDAQTSHAAILLSMEAVFAALDGWLILDESLPLRGILGCALMLGGMLISQLSSHLFQPKHAKAYQI